MQPHIDATKNGIASVAESLKNCYAGVDLRIAFVGYTDFDMHTEQARVTLFHFNRDLRPFIRALAKIEADGGGDAPTFLAVSILRSTSSNGDRFKTPTCSFILLILLVTVLPTTTGANATTITPTAIPLESLSRSS